MKILFHRSYIFYKTKEALFAILIGIVSGLAASFLDFLVQLVHKLSFNLNFAYIQLFVLAVYASFINNLDKAFSTPGLILALKFLKENVVVPFLIWTAKFFGVVLSLSILPIGREGPAMLLGAGLGQYLAELFRVPKGQLSYWGTIGAAAFVGAFLKTPLGATFYVFENRFGKILNVDFIINASTASTVSYTIYLYLRGFHPIIPIQDHFTWSVWDIVPAIGLGIITSVVAIFAMTIYEIFKRLSQLVDEPFKPITVLPILLLLFTIAYHLNSIELLKLAVDYKPLEEISSQLYPISTLIGVILLEILFVSILLSFGYPGGIILPLIFIGASLGNIVAHIDPNKLGLFVLTGASAMICAAMNVPITAVVMISEMSHQTLVIPEIVAVLTAYFLASSVKLLKNK